MGWGWGRRGLTMRDLRNCGYFIFPGNIKEGRREAH